MVGASQSPVVLQRSHRKTAPVEKTPHDLLKELSDLAPAERPER